MKTPRKQTLSQHTKVKIIFIIPEGQPVVTTINMHQSARTQFTQKADYLRGS